MSAGDLVLMRFAWGDADPAQILRQATAAAGAADAGRALHLFDSLDGSQGYAYAELAADPGLPLLAERLQATLPDATVVPLSLLMALSGASAGAEAPYRYVVETDVLPDREADFNAWYDGEHLAGLASVPGTVRAARYRDPAGHPRYHACYDLVQPEILDTPAWLAVRATPWSDRVRPTFVNTRRTMFRRCR